MNAIFYTSALLLAATDENVVRAELIADPGPLNVQGQAEKGLQLSTQTGKGNCLFIPENRNAAHGIRHRPVCDRSSDRQSRVFRRGS